MTEREREQRVTRLQREAVCRLHDHANYDDGWGVIGAIGSDGLHDGQPWINWRTVHALERRGLVESDHELQRLRLTPQGQSYATDRALRRLS